MISSIVIGFAIALSSLSFPAGCAGLLSFGLFSLEFQRGFLVSLDSSPLAFCILVHAPYDTQGLALLREMMRAMYIPRSRFWAWLILLDLLFWGIVFLQDSEPVFDH